MVFGGVPTGEAYAAFVATQTVISIAFGSAPRLTASTKPIGAIRAAAAVLDMMDVRSAVTIKDLLFGKNK